MKAFASLLTMISLSVALSACGKDHKKSSNNQAPQKNVPGVTSDTAPPAAEILEAAVSESYSDLKENQYTVTDFAAGSKSFYYRFADVAAQQLTLELNAEISSCETDPVSTFSLIDVATGRQVPVLAIAQTVSFTKPAGANVLLKATFTNLATCMLYGGSFSLMKQ